MRILNDVRIDRYERHVKNSRRGDDQLIKRIFVKISRQFSRFDRDTRG